MTETKQNLIESLRAALSNGDAGAVAVIQDELRRVKPIDVGNKAAELKQEIESANARLDEIREEVQVLEAERAARNTALALAMDAHKAAQFAVNDVVLALYSLDAEAENCRDTRRQCAAELNDLTAATIQEFTGEN